MCCEKKWRESVYNIYTHDIKKREPERANESAALLLFNDLHGAFANLFSPLCHVRLQQQYISWNEKSVCSVVRELLWSRLLGARLSSHSFVQKDEVIARWARAAEAFYASFMQILKNKKVN